MEELRQGVRTGGGIKTMGKDGWRERQVVKVGQGVRTERQSGKDDLRFSAFKDVNTEDDI